MADRPFDEEKIPTPQRQGMPGKTPGQAEGEDETERRGRPYPNAPNKTPGIAEGERTYIPGEEYSDPGTLRLPIPKEPE